MEELKTEEEFKEKKHNRKKRASANKCVGVEHTSIKPINVNGSKDGHLLSHVASMSHNVTRNVPLCVTQNAHNMPLNDIEEASPSLKMKTQIVDLMTEIESLRLRIDKLSDQSLLDPLPRDPNLKFGRSRVVPANSLRLREMEAVANHVAYIKTKFQALKRNGSSMYCKLEEQEKELLKDISSLKIVVNEALGLSFMDRTTSGMSNQGKHEETEGRSECHEELNESRTDRLQREEIDHLSDVKVGKTRQKTSAPQVTLPCFKHKWGEKDHSLFVKVYQKFKKEQIVEELHRMYPFKSEKDILDHIANYEAYLKQREAVKNQLVLWKQLKDIEKKEQKERVAEEKQQEELKQMMIDRAKQAKFKKEREMRKRELIAWKDRVNTDTESDRKDVKVTENQHKFPKNSVVKPHAYTEEEREEIALRLKEYYDRREKEMWEAKLKKEEEEMLKKRTFNPQYRARFLEKNREYISQRKAKKAAELRLQEDKMARLQKIKCAVQVKVERNQDRLLQETQSHLAYKLTQEGSSTRNTPVNIDSVPHLGTPVWRQGL